MLVRVSDLANPDDLEVTTRNQHGFCITLDPFVMIHPVIAHETLIHGWAHAYTWRAQNENASEFVCDHDHEWSGAYGQIYTAYFDDGGDIDADEFSPDPWR